jgi:hypothetical protein
MRRGSRCAVHAVHPAARPDVAPEVTLDPALVLPGAVSDPGLREASAGSHLGAAVAAPHPAGPGEAGLDRADRPGTAPRPAEPRDARARRAVEPEPRSLADPGAERAEPATAASGPGRRAPAHPARAPGASAVTPTAAEVQPAAPSPARPASRAARAASPACPALGRGHRPAAAEHPERTTAAVRRPSARAGATSCPAAEPSRATAPGTPEPAARTPASSGPPAEPGPSRPGATRAVPAGEQTPARTARATPAR